MVIPALLSTEGHATVGLEGHVSVHRSIVLLLLILCHTVHCGTVSHGINHGDPEAVAHWEHPQRRTVCRMATHTNSLN